MRMVYKDVLKKKKKKCFYHNIQHFRQSISFFVLFDG